MAVLVRLRCKVCGYVTREVQGATTYQVRSAFEEANGWHCGVRVEDEDVCYDCSTKTQKEAQAAEMGGSPPGRFQIFSGTRRVRRRVEAILARHRR